MNVLPKIDPEYKALIPPLLPEERSQLEANILAYGCKNALVTWNGTVIDGHNRLEICTEHGIEFEIVEMELPGRESAKLWILNEQLGRRNLNDAARIEIALMKKELLREQAKKNQIRSGGDKTRAGAVLTKSPNDEIWVRKSLAKDAAVGQGTLQRYLQIKKQADSTLLEKVQLGELKIGTAHKMLGTQMLHRLKFAKRLCRYIAVHAPDDDPEICTRLTTLQNLRQTLIENIKEAKNAKNQSKI